MHLRSATACLLLLAAPALALSACDPNDPTSAGPPTATRTAQVTKAVPKFTGMGLQAAQDAAQAAGFYRLTSHDSAGRDRAQLLDRDWKVCSQKPAAGQRVSVGTTLDFGAVKVAETCPRSDRKPPAKAGKSMPNLLGRGLNTASAELLGDTSFTTSDVSGRHRVILLPSNWKVCTQVPSPGTPLKGRRVALGAVKFGEPCP